MNSLKSRAMNCGPLSEMIRGLASGYFSLARLQDDLDFRLGHRLAQIPMHDEAAVAVQHAAQVVERAADVDVGNIDVPMLVRLRAAARSPSLSWTACPSTSTAAPLGPARATRWTG